MVETTGLTGVLRFNQLSPPFDNPGIRRAACCRRLVAALGWRRRAAEFPVSSANTCSIRLRSRLE